jgi:glycosyltransferase involved in cell wall biosynthesis
MVDRVGTTARSSPVNLGINWLTSTLISGRERVLLQMNRSNDPDLTVIVTVYKRQQYLKDALNSVRQQALEGRRLEVIVADDAAPSAARQIVEDLGWAEARYRPNPVRMGVAISVREALRSARGSYVSILNDDDLWEPGFLLSVMAPLEANPDLVLAFSDHWIIDEDGSVDLQSSEARSRRFGRALHPGGEITEVGRAAVLDKTSPISVGAIFRRDAIDPDLITSEVGGAYDYWIACLLAHSGQPFYYIPRRLSRYREHPRMETLARRVDRREDELHILEALVAYGWFPDLRWALRRRLSSVHFFAGANKLLRFGIARAARKDFLRGLHAFPNPFCLAGLVVSLLPPSLLRTALPLAERTEPLRALLTR